ncbi:MAG: hypothetical protein PHU42_00955 [Patescibacteria group bacterium]|nr:hypothetical protein [Patescibacteria group bacterium]
MADQDLVDYIKENKAKYGVDTLRKGLLAQGISYKEFKEAMEMVEQEEDEKIAGFLTDAPEVREETIIVKEYIGRGARGAKEYQKKAGEVIGNVSTALGVGEKDKTLYLDIIKYGAIAFVFFNIITTVFKYFGGRIVYPKVAASLGVFGHLALPDVLMIKIELWPLTLSVLWSAVLGGVLTFLFVKYIARFWPFSIWLKFQQKLFYFYIIFEFIFGIFINGLISAISGIYLLGYLIVLVGIVIAAYLSSNYLANVLETKHEDAIKRLVR